ncbi:MAG: hypothetical protein IPF41_05515 [Flavobacteriales bacterium]|nr:hypothetical protein [Flavobacteriales bacterium]
MKDGSVPQLTLDNRLVDRGDDEQMDFDFGPFQGESKTGLNQVLAALDRSQVR